VRPVAFWTLLFLVVNVVGFSTGLFSSDPVRNFRAFRCGLFHGHCHCSDPPRPASNSLKTLASAQADFRANDRDGDGKATFWRADVAGLYALAPGGGPAIKLIELSVALADDCPKTDLKTYGVPSMKAGYWFRAIRHADEDPKSLDPNRFAYCAFPDTPSAGKYIYILDENNTIFRSVANGRRGIDVFPTDEELVKSWSKLD
jgi:hypothetical protein